MKVPRSTGRTDEDESAEGEDLGEEDRGAEQEYRYGQAATKDDAEYKEYYHHPRQVQETQFQTTVGMRIGELSLFDVVEFEAPTVSTTTECWASADEPAESQEYVNDNGSEEEGWIMVKRRKLVCLPCSSLGFSK
ncbi:hypothetical protein L596_007968 [Steinernema carpocapsae]|uniref:Uncharacterized protein n=1 Tax=Steinernema carpocapsae TaxID=34508 RepID=A0A4V6A697_STECR|nr:hypothetical protein L596_007968 [Steinernema carpocapsae]